MSNQWREEQTRCLREIERHQNADGSYLDEGVQLLELARNAQRVPASHLSRGTPRPMWSGHQRWASWNRPSRLRHIVASGSGRFCHRSKSKDGVGTYARQCGPKTATGRLAPCEGSAFHSSRAREPAVDVKGLPGDETGVFARQKRDGSGQVGRLLGALNGLHV
jgi:hypothetical protein